MHRLFADGSYRGPLAVAGRRRPRSSWRCCAGRGVRLARRGGLDRASPPLLFITWTRFPDTTPWLLPTGDTARQAARRPRARPGGCSARSRPRPRSRPASSLATARRHLAAGLRGRLGRVPALATFEALLPSTTLFVFAAALGADRQPGGQRRRLRRRPRCSSCCCTAPPDQERSSRWVGGRHRAQGRWSLLGTGAMLAGGRGGRRRRRRPATCPAPATTPLIAWRDIDKRRARPGSSSARWSTSQTGWSTSPTSRCSRSSDRAARTGGSPRSTSSTARSGARRTARDEADGDAAPGDRRRDRAATRHPASSRSTALSSVWLPAAFEPRRSRWATTSRRSATSDRARSIVDRGRRPPPTGSLHGHLAAARVRRRPAARGAADVPDDIAETLPAAARRLPRAGRAELADERHRARRRTPYDKALALQDFFRDASPTTSTCRRATATTRSRRSSSRPSGATASSSPARSPPWPAPRPAGPGGGRLHPRRPGPDDPDALPGAGRARPRLARGLPRRVRLGALRAHARPGPAGRRAVARRRPSSRTRAPVASPGAPSRPRRRRRPRQRRPRRPAAVGGQRSRPRCRPGAVGGRTGRGRRGRRPGRREPRPPGRRPVGVGALAYVLARAARHRRPARCSRRRRATTPGRTGCELAWPSAAERRPPAGHRPRRRRSRSPRRRPPGPRRCPTVGRRPSGASPRTIGARSPTPGDAAAGRRGRPRPAAWAAIVHAVDPAAMPMRRLRPAPRRPAAVGAHAGDRASPTLGRRSARRRPTAACAGSRHRAARRAGATRRRAGSSSSSSRVEAVAHALAGAAQGVAQAVGPHDCGELVEPGPPSLRRLRSNTRAHASMTGSRRTTAGTRSTGVATRTTPRPRARRSPTSCAGRCGGTAWSR